MKKERRHSWLSAIVCASAHFLGFSNLLWLYLFYCTIPFIIIIAEIFSLVERHIKSFTHTTHLLTKLCLRRQYLLYCCLNDTIKSKNIIHDIQSRPSRFIDFLILGLRVGTILVDFVQSSSWSNGNNSFSWSPCFTTCLLLDFSFGGPLILLGYDGGVWMEEGRRSI